jgi:hypothetical protein
MTHSEKIQQAHEYNLDAAYREIEMREAQGEDMSTAYVDETTYAVVKREKSSVYLGDFSEHELNVALKGA